MLRSDTLFGKRDTNSPTSTLNPTGNIMPAGAALTKSSPTTLTTEAPTTNSEGGSKLIVGPNIKLKGVEITDCDTLYVEGRVEATIDSRVIQIAEVGAFKGSAEIDIAEIRGEFDGDLTVRQRLVIYSTGKVSGKIRYGKLVVEEGGQMSGDIQVGTSSSSSNVTSTVSKPLAVANGN